MHRLREGPGATHHEQYFSLSRLQRVLTDHGLLPERVQGFRLGSFPRGWLEDHRWYFELHRWFGRHTPGLCGEVCVTALPRFGHSHSRR